MEQTISTTAIGGSSSGGDGQQGRSVAAQTQTKASELTSQAQESAQQAADQAKGKLREQIDQRSQQAAEQINQQATDLRAVSDSLREQGKHGLANGAGKLAEYAEHVGGYLREKDAEALLADAEECGRRQPWAVAAGGLALGFAASRLLKASSRRRYSKRSSPGVAPPQPPSQYRSVPFATEPPEVGPAPVGSPHTPPASPGQGV
jgi:GTPase involved in cell partitioning and DNA repair